MALKFAYVGINEAGETKSGVFYCHTRKNSKAKLHIEKELGVDFGLWKEVTVVRYDLSNNRVNTNLRLRKGPAIW